MEHTLTLDKKELELLYFIFRNYQESLYGIESFYPEQWKNIESRLNKMYRRETVGICKHCGKEFDREMNPSVQYCSDTCRDEAKKEQKRLSKQRLNYKYQLKQMEG